MAALAKQLNTTLPETRAELTAFPSGGAMLDVHYRDWFFVMAYVPEHGFGVDQVRDSEGLTTSYQFAFREFEPAATKLMDLISAQCAPGDCGRAIALNLVVLHAKDIEVTRRFYELLGLEFVSEKHGSGPTHYACRLGEAVMEIYPCTNAANVIPTRIGFRAEAVDRLVDSVRRAGFVVHSAPRDSQWGRRAVVCDPEGNRVELCQIESGRRTIQKTQQIPDALYEADETAWLETMAQLIQQRRFHELDYAHLGEYLADMARRDRREVERRLTRLMAYVLQQSYQPNQRSLRTRLKKIIVQRHELEGLIENGVLRDHAKAVLGAAYADAVKQAAAETGFSAEEFPKECPYDLDQLLAHDLLNG
jgi:lactoylglutathione lyase